MPPTLLSWLTTLDADELATCLRLRPDVLWGVPVADLEDLAERLEHPGSVTHAITGLAAPWLTVLEVLTALGDGASVEAAAGLLSGSAAPETHDADVRAVVDALVAAALVVPGRDGALAVNPGALAVFLAPLALAPPARSLLDGIPVAELMRRTRRWGMDVAKRRADVVDAVAGRLADHAHVRRVVGEAPPEVADVLLAQVRVALDRARSAAWTADGPEVRGEDDAAAFDPVVHRRDRAAWAWAVEHGLAYPVEPYSTSVTFPSEVFVALAPPGFAVRFSARPPAVPTAPVPAQLLASAAGGAVTEWLGTAMAVLELVLREPIAVLQSGGVGAREVQRVAKSVGGTTDDVRLVLEIATAVGLVAVSGRSLVASTELAAWRGETPAQRAGALVRAWFELPTIATVDRHADGRTRPALIPLPEVRDPTGIRAVLVSAAADLDDGAGVASTDALVDVVRWRLPLAADPWSPSSVLRTWAEAERLGVVVAGACTDIGRAVLRGGPRELETVLTSVLPAVQRRALIGSDLTVVVPGSPDPSVVDVLDAVAVREARGAASTWRLTAASVREALDGGLTADAVLSALEEVGGTVPQPVEYLVRDVGRRHGHLRVRSAATVLTGDDEAVLAEVVTHRGLRHLGVRQVAPTVLVAAAPVPQVLSAMRSAGFLPVEVSDDGSPVVSLRAVPPRRGADGAAARRADADQVASSPPAAATEGADEVLRRWAREQTGALLGDRPPPPPRPDTPDGAAQRLVRGDGTPRASDLATVEQRLRDSGLRLGAAEVRQLAHALVHGRPVSVRYRSSSGSVTVRLLSDLQLLGGSLYAWCHLREDQRSFRLSRILAISAVPGAG